MVDVSLCPFVNKHGWEPLVDTPALSSDLPGQSEARSPGP